MGGGGGGDVVELELDDMMEGGHGGSFCQLLLANGVVGVELFDEPEEKQSRFIFPKEDSPRMLCFGRDRHDEEEEARVLLFPNAATETNPRREPARVSSSTRSTSSSSRSSHDSTIVSALPETTTRRRREGNGEEKLTTGSAPVPRQRSCKKGKILEDDRPSSNALPKKRKEKLGERIMALQQLVSPFGKTDTASVLHEAMGYIKFLHEQVEVLCSPYLHLLQPLPSSPSLLPEARETQGEESKGDLRSRGLCLVPVAWSLRVQSSNGADLWSPSMGSCALSSSSAKE